MAAPWPTDNGGMTVSLAPMEGIMDSLLRAVMAGMGGFDYSVTEFIRISQRPLSAKQVAALVPELSRPTALPTQVQLLGSHPEFLAHTALEACTAGARAIDMNFGCPSPTVIRNGGGSALLKEPAKIRSILETIRKALPPVIPLSAKVRLGWESPAEIHEIAQAVFDGGAAWITIHARTKKDFYKPGVHWNPVAEVRATAPVPVVANGDIFDEASFGKWRENTGCSHFMLGRGALMDPLLAQRLKSSAPDQLASPHDALIQAIRRFVELASPGAQNKGYVPSRVKQWLQLVRVVAPERIPKDLFSAVAHSHTAEEILGFLA